jgi:SAM-dependent methyltransferase
MTNQSTEQVRALVRDHYAQVAQKPSIGCAPGCCAPGASASVDLGYSEEDLASAPGNLGLGCGNPHAIAGLREGETVLDLGSGAGFDCFLAAKRVGQAGRVIGVDMTAEMIGKARANAAQLEAKNVEFRLGEIEHLPVSDASVDVILSNCVVNLSPDKAQVYRDAFRVLRAGGRIAISDVVMIGELPEAMKKSIDALTGCVSGAARVEEIERMLKEAGFSDVRVTVKAESKQFIEKWFPGAGIETAIASANIEATKPSLSCCAPTCCGDG